MTERTNPLSELFPSEDGNAPQRERLLSLMERLITEMDAMKDPERAVLGELRERRPDFYQHLIDTNAVPVDGVGLDQVVRDLVSMLQGHPYQTRGFLTNVLPMSSIPGLLGALTTVLVNSNNLWDVYGPAAAEGEVRSIAMMARMAGYDPRKAWGYTTWGGQGAVFSGLRIAIVKHFPEAKERGVPSNLYCFASEGAHYSLLKSVETTGIGSDHLVRVKTREDHSMDPEDLRRKMREVVRQGGVPIYVVATTGTTDSFAIDDVREIKEAADAVTSEHGLKPVHLHADSAWGGFYCFFNEYDFGANPLAFEPEVLTALAAIRKRMQHLHLADSLCFDFQKLGQTPYVTSLFLLKDGADLRRVDLKAFDTPYVGNRGYGSYHTSYTLECSRPGSGIAIYAALRAFGITGYRRLLANYLRVNLVFRRRLLIALPCAAVTNARNPAPMTTFRFYADKVAWEKELAGQCTLREVEATNALNQRLFELLGKDRAQVLFGDTTKQCLVPVIDSPRRVPISVVKLVAISPYTQVEHVQGFVNHLTQRVRQLIPASGHPLRLDLAAELPMAAEAPAPLQPTART